MHDFRFADMTEPRCKLSTLGADDLARIGGTVIAQAAADLDAVRTDQRNQIAVREITLVAHHANRQQTAALFAPDARGPFVEMPFAVQLHLSDNQALARGL